MARGLNFCVITMILATLFSFSAPAASKTCNRYFFSLTSQISSTPVPQTLRDLKKLRIVTYNMLNLYVHLGKFQDTHGIQITQKPRWALDEMAQLFELHPFDIMVAQEVESIDSAHLFNKQFLKNQFDVYATQTKDKRGLCTVFFVRKTLPLDFKIQSHLSEMWTDPLDGQVKEVFPRDIPTLHIFDRENPQAPLLSLIGVHFKSKGSRDVILEDESRLRDKESTLMREAQANRATKIIQRYQLQYGFEHPILIAGDFNNSHNYAPEFYGFYRHTHLVDTLSLMPHLNYLNRVSHAYFGGGRPEYHQLDGILVVPSVQASVLDSYALPYYQNNRPKRLPKTKGARKKNPSDHFPIMVIFDFQKLIGAAP